MQIQSSSLQMSMQHSLSARLSVSTRGVSAPTATLAAPSLAAAADREPVRAHGHRGDDHHDAGRHRRLGDDDHHGRARRSHGARDEHGRPCEVGSECDRGEVSDPGLRMLRQVIEWLTGESVDVFDASDLQPGSGSREAPAPTDTVAASPAASATATPATTPQAGAWLAQAAYRETETLQVRAEGTVHTADGQTLSFSIELQMRRSFSASVTMAGVSTPPPRDPLVVNHGGTAASLSDRRFSFDLNSDGRPDSVRLPGSGSGLLVFDRNGNGRLDGASELFGPDSGDGFADLARLDDDGNGWVDGADAAFERLGVLDDAAPEARRLRPLAGLGIGALSTSRIDSPFSLKDARNELLGQVRATGLYLGEDGRAGTVQQLDVVV